MKALTDFKPKKTDKKQTDWIHDVQGLERKYAQTQINMQ